MNVKILCLVLGLLAGGIVGWLTRPQVAEIRLPGIDIKLQGEGPRGGLTSEQSRHIGLAAVVGAIIGLGVGFVAERRR
ncbi:hypothetical protein V5F59_14285 [Xanthobacter autotrophicus DSM 431]|uniref:hypothetical protein n=1 Tax=Xanthobacter nonsaccharivorans TaxID=3119912 RepID=UPI00372BF534